jgi:hypothetical protein
MAALIAVMGIAGIPAVSNAAQATAAKMQVAVKPYTGSTKTHFAVSFRAAVQTGVMSSLYRPRDPRLSTSA